MNIEQGILNEEVLDNFKIPCSVPPQYFDKNLLIKVF